MPPCTEETIFDFAQPLLGNQHLHVAKICNFQKWLLIIFNNVWFLSEVAANGIETDAKKIRLDFLRTRS